VKNQQEKAMSEEKKREPKKTRLNWDFMEMKNPPPGVREKTLKYFRDNPISVTIRPARALRPVAQPRKEDEEGAPESE
jgi:hypothetical protein